MGDGVSLWGVRGVRGMVGLREGGTDREIEGESDREKEGGRGCVGSRASINDITAASHFLCLL